MSEESSSQDTINTDNAEEHGLETITTPEGERYFLNPGNGIMYPRDVTFQAIALQYDPVDGMISEYKKYFLLEINDVNHIYVRPLEEGIFESNQGRNKEFRNDWYVSVYNQDIMGPILYGDDWNSLSYMPGYANQPHRRQPMKVKDNFQHN